MSSRFEKSGVGEPEIDTYIFDEQFRQISPEDVAYSEGQAIKNDICGYSDELELINRASIPNPRWYKEMEHEARSYMQALGFPNLPPMFLLGEGDETAQISMLVERDAYAQTMPFNQFAVVREAKIHEAIVAGGTVRATSVLVHELAHLTLQHMSVAAMPLKKREFHDDYVTVRAGMMFIAMNKFRGKFLEEGFASYVAGCFVRAASGDTAPTAIASKPDAYVPAWYRIADDGIDPFGGETTMGPDGYAIEMLAWASEKRGIMTATDFQRNLFDTRHKNTEAGAMRNIIRTMNLIQPKLYSALSKIAYDKEGSIDGCVTVYEAVTGEIWQDS